MNIKRYVAASVAVGMALSAVAAFADTTPTPTHSPRPTKTPSRTEIRQKIEEKKAEIKEKREEVKAKVADKRKERIQSFWDHMKKRLQRLIDNQTKLADRIAKRLDKASANGKDVVALKTQLDAAKALIKQAQDALNAGDAAVADIIAKNEPKDALKKVQQLNKDILAKIKAAHEALNKVIRATKGLGEKPTPTPTASPTPTPTT